MTVRRQLPLIVAHRGASFDAPENTLTAFSLALAMGAEGVEMDVRLSGDGVPVVFHDATLKRFTGESKRVDGMSISELGRVRVGEWFNRNFPKLADDAFLETGVPTLADTIALLEGFKGPIFIELKCRDEDARDTAEAVVRVLSAAQGKERFIVKSFALDAIHFVKAADSRFRTAALFAPKVMSVIRKEKRLVNIARDVGADSLSVHFSLATRKLMKKSRRSGLPVAVWTVDSSRWMKKALDLGIEALITNRPDRMLLRRRELLHRNSITA